MELGRKTFTTEAQEWFAVFSGDRNPMHMDAAAARRTQMGVPVIHGVHPALWAFELACAKLATPPRSLRVQFAGPIYVGDTAAAVLVAHSDTQARVQVRVDGVVATTLTIGMGAAGDAKAWPDASTPANAEWPAAPIALDFDAMNPCAGAFAFARPFSVAAEAFPSLARAIGPERTTAIAATSRLVGMVCPGLHSIFSGFTLEFVEGPREPALRYRTSDVDDRFRLVTVALAGGGLQGELAAFARLPPIAQPSMAEMAARTPADAYAGAVALIIGGSRGLGEAAAKACAAGGARVIITYATGKTEAHLVATEIANGGGTCDVMRFDARAEIGPQLRDLPAIPSHLYYFATGPIAIRRTRVFSPDVLADFNRFYITAFFDTCAALLAQREGKGLAAFYPSSVAVEEAPKGWAEYAMAKAAGEVLCREMTLHLPGVEVLMRRLPRILTDQTASVLAAEAAPVMDVIPPIVAELQRGSASS